MMGISYRSLVAERIGSGSIPDGMHWFMKERGIEVRHSLKNAKVDYCRQNNVLNSVMAYAGNHSHIDNPNFWKRLPSR